MGGLVSEKLRQASALLAGSPLDAWLIFVRETAGGGDRALPFLLEGSLTWISALLLSRDRRTAIVGTYDAGALIASGDWDDVIPYDRDIRAHLIAGLEALGSPEPRIGVNFSPSDEKCDGLTHGMFLLLEQILRDTRFAGRLESAHAICTALRSRKTPEEVRRIVAAVEEGDRIFEEIAGFARIGVSEREVYDRVHALATERRLEFSWEAANDPIVNSGPDSMVGHGVPSERIRIEEGHVFHVDLGVKKEGYSSDVQRSWYVGEAAPPDVLRAFDSVRRAIIAGSSLLKPGVPGWEVDRAARSSIKADGYDEYLHALGHQVGRFAHDGGALLGPRWERYGDRPLAAVSEGEVYTLELGVDVPGRGYLGLEEMVLVTDSGPRWLSDPQTEIMLLR